VLGNAGRDLIVGGLGVDQLEGGAHDDLMLPGGTYFESAETFSIIQIGNLMTEWTRTDQIYRWRVMHILNGDGLNNWSINPLFFDTFDDATPDRLTGGSGQDWFFTEPHTVTKDKITDLQKDEIITELPSDQPT
jgi:Ca2+-binding RTX toxin-like protein